MDDRKGNTASENATCVIRFTLHIDRLAEFHEPDETRTWLYSRNDLLDGNRAVELIQNDRTGEVHAVIERLESLTYR